VRVVLTEHFTNDTRALFVRAGGGKPHVVHGIEDAAMHRLQPIAGVGQRARHDHAHGVVEIGGAHLLFDEDVAHQASVQPSAVGCGAVVIHAHPACCGGGGLSGGFICLAVGVIAGIFVAGETQIVIHPAAPAPEKSINFSRIIIPDPACLSQLGYGTNVQGSYIADWGGMCARLLALGGDRRCNQRITHTNSAAAHSAP
jgi:hypothetical protein